MKNQFFLMRGNRFVFFVLLAFFSCNKTDEEAPYIIPIVEIKGATKLNDREVKLISTIKEMGSLEILEHGFLFSETNTPSYTTDLVWKSTEEPDLEFEAVLEKALPMGETYFIQAYLKTEKAITYSPVFEFKTPGPTTLTIDEIFFPAIVYYDDTVRVRARNLPAKLGDLFVQFQKANVEVIDMSENEFRFKIPRSARLSADYEDNGSPIEFRVGTDIVNRIEKVKFRKPEFPQLTEVSMAYPWKLDGKYLYDSEFTINLFGDPENIGNLVIQEIKDNELIVLPKASFVQSNPGLLVYIRGIQYPISHIKIKTSDFEPNQQIDYSDIYQKTTAKTSDFNVFVPQANRVVSEVPNQVIVNVSNIENNVASLGMTLVGPVPDRKIILYANNHGEKGKIPLQINLKTPAIPVSYLYPDGQETFWGNAVGIPDNNNIQFFSEFGSIIYNTQNTNISLGGPNTAEAKGFSNFRVELNGKFYFSEEPLYSGTLNTTIMYAYDTQKKQLEVVNYLPQDGYITSSFESEGYMFLEVMFQFANNHVKNLWKWDGTNNTEWEIVRTDTLNNGDGYFYSKNFRRGNFNYRFIEYFDPATGNVRDKLEQFNTETNQWVFLKSFPNNFDNDFRAFPAPEGIYLTNGLRFYIFNPVSLNLTYLGENPDLIPQVKSLVYRDGFFYYIPVPGGPSLIYELDISLLKP